MALIEPVTSETLAAALQAHIGLSVPPERIKLERRGSWRWIAFLPDDLMVFVPGSAAAADRLAAEGELLERLVPRVSFGLPRVRYADPGRALQIRSMVPGAQIGGDGREEAFASLPQGPRLADDLGRALGELHDALSRAEAEALGLQLIRPLPDVEAFHAGLEGKLSDPLVAPTLERLLKAYLATEPLETEIALAHGDLWGGNLAVDLETGALNGLFDFGNTGLADRNFDFMHIHSFGPAFTQRCFAAYARQTGRKLSPQRSALYHAMFAFIALAEVRGHRSHLLEGRLQWVSGVCRGPIVKLALGDPAD